MFSWTFFYVIDNLCSELWSEMYFYKVSVPKNPNYNINCTETEVIKKVPLRTYDINIRVKLKEMYTLNTE